MLIRYRRPLQILQALVVTAAICQSPLSSARDEIDPIFDHMKEGGSDEFNYDDSQDIPWIENETKVLAMPEPDNLTEVRLGELPQGMTLLVDKSRITVNPEDKVVRAWLWLRNDAGVDRGTFEGFRCDSFRYKVYAFGNPRHTPPVTKAKNPRWLQARKNFAGDYRWELMGDYFCGYRQSRSAREIAEYLTGEYQPDPIFEYH